MPRFFANWHASAKGYGRKNKARHGHAGDILASYCGGSNAGDHGGINAAAQSDDDLVKPHFRT